jgi:dTDP-4-dehydrorhamnose 3,5-epimerase-like enzyme
VNMQVIHLKIIGDERGSLIAIESNINIPLEIKRVYYIFNTKQGVRRGFHAHRSLIQMLICTSGSCKVLVDDGEKKVDVLLDSPSKGLILGPMTWHEMYEFSPNCVLMVLANEIYDEKDYIRDYNLFLQLYQKEKKSIKKEEEGA